VLFDVILIDTCGRLGPATGALIRSADVVLVVIDDTILGLTAVDLYLNFIKNLVGSPDRLCFLVNPCSNALMTVQQIAAELEPAHRLGAAPWRLPALPFETKAALWAGSSQTLYSMGSKSMRQTLDKVARELGLIGVEDVAGPLAGSPDGTGRPLRPRGNSTSSWLSRMFGRKGEASTR
jgi:cellulose biosynthesis protein BcsQ